MKVRKTLSKILVLIMIFILGWGSLISFAENQTEKVFVINDTRYVNGNFTGKYALNDGLPRKIFQILSKVNEEVYDGTNYYCLNALTGTWASDTSEAEVPYNKNYKLKYNVENGIENLKNDTTEVYSNIANSNYLYEILWILDNIYVSSTNSEENENNKQALLNAAGMRFKDVSDEQGTARIWKYLPTDTKYLAALNNLYPNSAEFNINDNDGWWYLNTNDEVQNIVISDDLIEVAQQTAIWYYTNFKDNNENNEDNRFNIKDKGLKNLWKWDLNSNDYQSLESDYFKNENDILVGKFEQEQATILAWHLIDAAEDYANSLVEKYGSREAALSHIDDEMEGNPLKISPEVATNTKNAGGDLVIGPIKIEKQREAKYNLENKIYINENTQGINIFENSDIYVSSENGTKDITHNNLNDLVGTNFYITIKKDKISDYKDDNNHISLKFKGNYLTNEKTLWVKEGAVEQPIVEVTPKSAEFDLSINTIIPLEGKYNIVLIKADENGEDLNSKAQFKVKYPNNDVDTKDVIGRLEIATNVKIDENNITQPDVYEITETKAPDRYSEFDGKIILTVTKKAEPGAYVVDTVTRELKDKDGNPISNTDDVVVEIQGDTIYVKVINYEKEFDLALQKYITKIISQDGENEIEGRQAPNVDVSNLNKEINGIKQTTANYIQDKTPKNVLNGDYVLYTITVYNEGELAGYVNKITDNIPKGLEFIYKDNDEKYYAVDYTGSRSELLNVTQNIKEKINENNAFWSIDKDSQNRPRLEKFNENETISVTCDVESYSRAKNIDKFNCLYAYDSSKNINNGSEGLDRLSVTLLLRVNSSEEVGTILRNEAAITEAEDMSRIRQDIDELSDRDSKVTKWPGKDGNKEYQDDEDYDNVVLQDEPKIHKGVKEVYNQDSGYDADEEQTWVIESDIPRNIDEYKKYDIVDDIDYRLKFSGIENVIVKIGTTTLVKDEDYKITYTENLNGVTNKTNSGTLKLEFISNNEMSNKLIENSGGKIRVTFKTTFAKDAEGKLLALLGEEVPNKARLDYDNKSTYSEEPEVHTGGITLYKHEKGKTNPVEGAEFTIYRTESDARNKQNKLQTATSGEDGIVRFIGLSYGGDAKDSEDNKTGTGIYKYDSSKKSTIYWVVETKTPEGYLSNEEPIEVEINSTSYEESVAKIQNKNKVPNTPITGKYSVILVKEDEDGVQLNETAEFMINNEKKVTQNGKITIVNNLLINKNNVDNKDLYTIIETKAPDKYSEFDGKITLEVSKKLSDDKNKYVVKDYKFTIVDKDDKEIENNGDARVTLEGNSIFVHVKNYEKDFDLKLMKYISEVNGKATNRNLTVDASKLNTIVDNKKVTTANYNVSKEPIEVRTGDYITYTLRVYNEGGIDGYAKEITEDIPEGLKFVTEEDKDLTDTDKEAINFNKARAWNVVEKNQDGTIKTVSTDYLSKAKGENNLITAYAEDGKEPKYKDVQIMLKVISSKNVTIRNEAAITQDEDKNGKEIADRDSDTEKWKKENSEDLYDNNSNYPKYKEDDEDYDNIIVKNVDLALTKFIVAISDDIKIEDGEYITADKKVGSKENPYLRATKVDTSKLKAGTANTADYEMVKDPLLVPAQSYVLYNIRVYNEGDVDVYAGEIKDHLPDYLDYVDCEFNQAYGWKLQEQTVSTNYLSAAQGKDNIIKAFDKENDDEKGSGLSYKDVQVLCKVNESAKSNEPIRNVAEVSKYEDKDGKEIEKDRDSIPDNGEKKEDDDDYEVIIVKTFDLNLIKFVSEVMVTEDGKTKTTATNNTGDNKKDIIPKVEVNKKKLNSTIVKFKYKIKITNEGDIEGYAKEITDYVPQGLKFYKEDNEGWTDEGNNVISTKLLEDKLLKPGESAEVTVTLRWINGSTNLGLKRNNAEISEDYNEDNVPDKDSTPDNKVPEEDDFDYADVLLSISTGISGNVGKIVLGTVILVTIFASGIISIKKFVL